MIAVVVAIEAMVLVVVEMIVVVKIVEIEVAHGSRSNVYNPIYIQNHVIFISRDKNLLASFISLQDPCEESVKIDFVQISTT